MTFIFFWFSSYIFVFFSYIPLSLIIWPGFHCLYAYLCLRSLRKAWLDQTDSYYASCLFFTLGYFVLVCNILTSSCSLFPKGPFWSVTEVFFCAFSKFTHFIVGYLTQNCGEKSPFPLLLSGESVPAEGRACVGKSGRAFAPLPASVYATYLIRYRSTWEAPQIVLFSSFSILLWCCNE